jgi:hypothetical protein
VAGHDLVGERQVVRRRLRRHPRAALPRPPHQVDSAGGARVRHVQVRAGQFGELHVARHDHLLRLGRHPRETEHARVVALVHLPALGQ